MTCVQLACRSEHEYRAVEMCNLMPSYHVAQLALKYASKLGKMHLADKVSEVVSRKMDESSLEHEDYSTRYESMLYEVLTFMINVPNLTINSVLKF